MAENNHPACPPNTTFCTNHCPNYVKCSELHDKEMDELYIEIMNEAERKYAPFREYVKGCPYYSWSSFTKGERPYNRCSKTGGYCVELKCPNFNASVIIAYLIKKNNLVTNAINEELLRHNINIKIV
jgi:hypothetical protein